MPLYKDGVLVATASHESNHVSLPQYFLLTNHITASGIDASGWTTLGAPGANFDIDYVRLWATPGTPYLRPLAAVADVNVDYNGTTSIVLPAAATLWGQTPNLEQVKIWSIDGIDPGWSDTGSQSQFGSMGSQISYNSGSRTLSIDWSAYNGNAGRCFLVVDAYLTVGSICQPLVVAINRGPVVNVSALNFTVGQSVSYDLYAQCDCGTLVSDSSGARAKTISISGLGASGLSYDDSTGLLTGTMAAGVYSCTVTVTNSIGQSVSSALTIAAFAATSYAYQSWTNLKGWFDASSTDGITTTKKFINSFVNKSGANGDLTVAGTAESISLIGNVQNGRSVARLVRNVSSPTAVPRAAALSTDAVSQVFQGDDQPFVAIIVLKPTDTNTGFPWSASTSLSTSANEQIAYTRRNTTASGIRKQPSGVSNEVTWSSPAGEVSGTVWIIAIHHTGTAVTVWRNSTTPIVNAAAQNVAAITTGAIFQLFAIFQNAASGTNPTPAITQGNMDLMECLVAGSQTTAEVQQAITDLAAKWGITLS